MQWKMGCSVLFKKSMWLWSDLGDVTQGQIHNARALEILQLLFEHFFQLNLILRKQKGDTDGLKHLMYSVSFYVHQDFSKIMIDTEKCFKQKLYGSERDIRIIELTLDGRQCQVKVISIFFNASYFWWQNLIVDVKSFSKYCNKIIFHKILFELQGLQVTVPLALHTEFDRVKISWILFGIISWITFIKMKDIGNYFSYFHFCTKNSFLCKNENKRYNLH